MVVKASLHPRRLTMGFGAKGRRRTMLSIGRANSLPEGSEPVVETNNFAHRLVNLKFDAIQ
jgi:hypothetical protein